ncbi:hypothetical protein CLV43_102491 [Umezawaea tangerina]|uniref:Uncharacterized protein n=2 Tax=Umezawaea tangerina TaxID=84725 RepID=A0A2T0TGV2_9PSEU|nr:hypothetical protein CLV43_102491 [Umezawaea tangerina]
MDLLPHRSSTTLLSAPDRDPIAVLAQAVAAAITDLRDAPTSGAGAGAAVDEMLMRFTAAMSPVRARIAELTAAEPGGQLVVVIGYLSKAFTQAAAGDVRATRAALIAASVALLRLTDAEHDAGGPDLPHWRF